MTAPITKRSVRVTSVEMTSNQFAASWTVTLASVLPPRKLDPNEPDLTNLPDDVRAALVAWLTQ